MNKNRKKKRKLNILLSCVAIIILVGFNWMMMAKTDDCVDGVCQNGGGSNGGSLSACTEGHWCYQSLGVGVRISVVDGTGKKLAGPYDIIGTIRGKGTNSDSLECQYGTYYTYGKKIKQEVSITAPTDSGADLAAIADIQLTSPQSTWYLSSAVKIEDIIGSPSNPSNRSHYAESYRKGVYDYLVKMKKQDKTKLNSSLNQLFDALGYKHAEEITAIEVENTYIQFEPIIIAREKIWGCSSSNYYQGYYGTVTELANMGLSASGKPRERDSYFRVNALYYYGSGMNIVNDGYPSETLSKVSSSGTTDWSTIMNNPKSGYGVAHIWLKDLLEPSDCFSLLSIVNDESNPNYWSGGVQNTAYHQAVAAIATGNTSYEITDKNGNKYTPQIAYGTKGEYFWLDQQNYSKRTELKGKASCYAPTVPCGTDTGTFSTNSEAIQYLHYSSGISLNTPEYDQAISQFRDGTYFYYTIGETKNEKGENVNAYDYFLIDRAYTDEGLKKENYGTGKAKCGNITNGCDAAVAYIEGKYFGTPDYDVKIGQVKNGTFNEDEYIVSEPQNYTGLIKSIYDSRNSGHAICDNIGTIPTTCGQPANIYKDNCITGNSWYKDNASEDMWLKCETAFAKDGTSYASENTGHIATEDSITINKIVGNREYCQVFCYEEVETSFPTKVEGVRAGRTFVWGNGDGGEFGTIKIKKVCKTQEQTDGGKSGDGYLYKKWEKDYVTNERNRTSNWIKKGAVEQLIERCSPPYNCVSTYSYCPVALVSYSCGTAEHPSTCWYCPVAEKYGYTPSAFQGHSQSTEWKLPEYGSATIYNSYSPTSSGSGYLTAYAALVAGHSAVMSELYGKQSELIGKETDYKRKEGDLIEKIRQCANRMKYVYATTVDFVFKEPENNSYGSTVNRKYYAQEGYEDFLLMEPANADDGITTNTRGGKNCHKEEIWLYKCIGTKLDSKCVHETSIWVDYCDQLEWNIEGSWIYKYKQEDFTWFSLKYNKDHPDETLMNQKEKNEKYSTVDENLFYSIGFGLPTALSLPNGSYGTNPNSPMKVIVSKLGDTNDDQLYDIDPAYVGEKNYHTVDGHFQRVMDAVSTKEGATYGFEYVCTYEVTNDMFGNDCKYDDAGNLTPDSPHYCDEHEDDNPHGRVLGIDVAYRLVGLLQDTDPISKAFPGRDGNGRQTGANWVVGDDNLREILRSDIYDNEAMYEIFLDVALIQRIREDNSTVITGDAYTSFENIICAGGNDKYCASDFVSRLARGDLVPGNYLVGTCVGETNTQARADAHGACDNNYTPLDVEWAR